MSTIFETPASLKDAVGKHLGESEWLEITQERIDQFAEATGDHQWIHVDPVRAKDGPFGACIAHGYLTQSLVNLFLPQIVEVPHIVQVVTGYRQVPDGTITVEKIEWVPTTVTEQTGFDEVKVGSEVGSVSTKKSVGP